jgi:hypothetical protein
MSWYEREDMTLGLKMLRIPALKGGNGSRVFEKRVQKRILADKKGSNRRMMEVI